MTVGCDSGAKNGNKQGVKRDDDLMRDLATLLARGVLGGSIAAHGAQKLLGWFGGPGLEGATGFMHSLGFRPPERYARLSAATEITAGALIVAGALGPVGPAILASVMTTAVGTVHLKNGYWNEKRGFELNTMYALGALLLAVNDSGRISLDQITGIRAKTSPLFGMLAIAGGIAGGIFMLSQRNVGPASQPETRHTSESGTIERSLEKLNMD